MGNGLRTLEATLWLGALAIGIGFASLYAVGKLPALIGAPKVNPHMDRHEQIEDLLGPRPLTATKVEPKAKAPAAPPAPEPVRVENPKIPAQSISAKAKPASANVVTKLKVLSIRRAPAASVFVPIKGAWPFQLAANEKVGDPSVEVSKFSAGSSSLYFAFGSAALTESATLALDKVAAAATANRSSRVVVRAFTDGVGSVCSNGLLSSLRARSVSEYLIAHGVAAKQISLFALGPQNAFSSNETVKGRSLNRRAEILLLS